MNYKEILILVKLPNGDVHQILASREQKELSLIPLLNDDGNIEVHPDILPLDFKVE